MQSQARLIEIVQSLPRMARGRLCVLSRSKSGGTYYHLQYRKNTRLFQKYVPASQAGAYERATALYREFRDAVDAFVDESSARTIAEIEKEAKNARRDGKTARGQDGRLRPGRD